MQAVVLGLAALGLAACPSKPSKRKAAPEVVDHLEIRVSAPGMSPASVEQLVVAPIELALVGNSEIRSVISEAHEGRARIELSLSRRAELVAVDVLQRLDEIQPQLPEQIERPVLRPQASSATTVHFGLDDDGGEAARSLIEALERTVGVTAVDRCGIERVITIELDPAALRRLGVEVGELERALGPGLPPTASVDELLELVVKQVDGSVIELADLASVRVEPAVGGCRAYSEQGPGVGFGVALKDSGARERVEAQLDAAREAGLVVRRFAARLHVWLDPTIEPERAVELIGARVGSARLIELGVEARPCAGPGTLARLHVTDDANLEAIAEALAAAPGVLLVEEPDRPRARRWLVGPDLELLVRHGGQAGVSSGGELKPELVVELDRDKLAALGVEHGAAISALRLALDGVEIGRLQADGVARAVVLKLGRVAEHDPVGLAELPLSASGIPLGTVAELRSELSLTRICRRDGERAVAVVMRSGATPASLPAGYRWLDER